MVWAVCRVGRIVLVELVVVRVVKGDRGRLQGRQKWFGGMLDGEAPVSCPGHVVGTGAEWSGGPVVVSRFLKSAIQMNFAENQSWPARRLGRAAGWESPGGPIREKRRREGPKESCRVGSPRLGVEARCLSFCC